MDDQAPEITVITSVEEEVPGRTSTAYPPPFDAQTEGRTKHALGDALGIADFGVNKTILAPGAATAHRHYHTVNDEMVYVLQGHPTLVSDQGERILGPGSAAGFPAGQANAHFFVNNTDAPVVLLEMGSRKPSDSAVYPDIDFAATHTPQGWTFTNKAGDPIQ